MRSRLAWAIGGFVLVALVVYRFLARVPAPAPDAAAAAEGESPAAAGGDEAPEEASEASEAAPEPASEAATAVARDDVAPGDPDERIRALRRKLEEAREAPPLAPEPAEPRLVPESASSCPAEPVEPPLDDRRQAVHEAGRSAADAMRRAAERRDRPEPPPGTADPAAPADPADPAS